MASLRSGDFSLAYDDLPAVGDPRGTVVLVHGFASNRAENWRRLGWYAALGRADYRVLALDLRGHGESDKSHDPADYRRAAMAGDIVALIAAAGLGRTHLVGYSMGAHIALAVALAAPDRIDRLVLGGVGARMLGEGPVLPAPDMSLAQALRADDPDAIADPIQRGFRRFAEQQGDEREALAACASAPGEPISRASLAGLEPRCLVVAGARDELAGDPQALADAIPGAEAVSLPGCDHFTAIPHALFKSAVLDFLEGWDTDVPAFE